MSPPCICESAYFQSRSVFASSFYSMSVVCQQNAKMVQKKKKRENKTTQRKTDKYTQTHVGAPNTHTHTQPQSKTTNVCHSSLKIASYKKRKRGRDEGREWRGVSDKHSFSSLSLLFLSLSLPVIRPNYGGADAWQPQSCSFN